MTTLKQLHLIIEDFNLIEDGAISLGLALEKLTTLQELHLEISKDKIKENGAKSIG